MIITPPVSTQRMQIRLSPQGYFRNFCIAHGQWVDDGKRLIFPDGWVWASNRDYQGPEVPPPNDEKELRRLLRMYWSIRVKVVRTERDRFVENIRVLHETSKQRSAPIAVEAWVPNAAGYLCPTAKDVDWTMLEIDAKHANQAVKDAEAELAKLLREEELLR